MAGRLMKVAEVADHFQVSTHTVYRWVEQGRLRPVRVGSLIRFSEASISDFLERSENERGRL